MEGEQKEEIPQEVYETSEGVKVKPAREVLPDMDRVSGVKPEDALKSNSVIGEALRTGKPVRASVKQVK